MSQVTVTYCDILGLYVIEPTVHEYARGYFMETYNKKDLDEAGVDAVFVQDYQSQSTNGVLRGLHYQKKHSHGKLVRVIRGEVYDVAVNMRKGSPTYGKAFGLILSEFNRKQFYISPGFAYGFWVLSDYTEFCYKCTDYYHPEDEHGIIWNDKDLNIDWPLELEGLDIDQLNVSEKDYKWSSFKDMY